MVLPAPYNVKDTIKAIRGQEIIQIFLFTYEITLKLFRGVAKCEGYEMKHSELESQLCTYQLGIFVQIIWSL